MSVPDEPFLKGGCKYAKILAKYAPQTSLAFAIIAGVGRLPTCAAFAPNGGSLLAATRYLIEAAS
jgi:hypothetical protein